MFARVVYGRTRQVTSQETSEAVDAALSSLKGQPGFVAAYFFQGIEDRETALSVCLWETREACLAAVANGQVQGAHARFSLLLAAPPVNKIVPVVGHG